MNARVAVLAAVLTAGAAAVPVTAKPLVCAQVRDATGDATWVDGSNHDAVDVVSADVATGKRNLVAVVRLKSLAADPVLTGGTTYAFAWSIGGLGQKLTLTRYADGSQASTLDPDTAVGASGDERVAPVVVAPTTSTVTWTIPRSADTALKKGAKLRGFDVWAYPALNVSVQGVSFSTQSNGDEATSGATYTDGTATCVKGT